MDSANRSILNTLALALCYIRTMFGRIGLGLTKFIIAFQIPLLPPARDIASITAFAFNLMYLAKCVMSLSQ